VLPKTKGLFGSQAAWLGENKKPAARERADKYDEYILGGDVGGI